MIKVGTRGVATLGESKVVGVISETFKSGRFWIIPDGTSKPVFMDAEWQFEPFVIIPNRIYAVVADTGRTAYTRTGETGWAGTWFTSSGEKFKDADIARILKNGGRVVFEGEK